jgi:uncharacterized protein YndB with AHSA1/START domain
MDTSENRVPERIEREVLIAAPVERVWAVVTEAEHIGAWFGDAGAEIDLRPGGLLVTRFKEHGTWFARVEKVEAPRFFSYRSGLGPDQEPTAGNSTLIEYTLTPEGTSTRLRVVESGFPSLAWPEEKKAKYVEGNTQGWLIKLGELRDYVQKLVS